MDAHAAPFTALIDTACASESVIVAVDRRMPSGVYAVTVMLPLRLKRPLSPAATSMTPGGRTDPMYCNVLL